MLKPILLSAEQTSESLQHVKQFLLASFVVFFPILAPAVPAYADTLTEVTLDSAASFCEFFRSVDSQTGSVSYPSSDCDNPSGSTLILNSNLFLPDGYKITFSGLDLTLATGGLSQLFANVSTSQIIIDGGHYLTTADCLLNQYVAEPSKFIVVSGVFEATGSANASPFCYIARGETELDGVDPTSAEFLASVAEYYSGLLAEGSKFVDYATTTELILPDDLSLDSRVHTKSGIEEPTYTLGRSSVAVVNEGAGEEPEEPEEPEVPE